MRPRGRPSADRARQRESEGKIDWKKEDARFRFDPQTFESRHELPKYFDRGEILARFGQRGASGPPLRRRGSKKIGRASRSREKAPGGDDRIPRDQGTRDQRLKRWDSVRRKERLPANGTALFLFLGVLKRPLMFGAIRSSTLC